MTDSQTGQGINQSTGASPLAGAAKYGAVGVLGFLAGAGTLWSVTTREPAPVIAAQQPTPVQLPPIVVQPPQVVIQMPAPTDASHSRESGPMGPSPDESSAMQQPVPIMTEPVAVTPPPTPPTPPTPTTAPTTPPTTTPSTAPSRTAKLNINDATAAQLELLPGIGPSLAGRIVAYRTSHGRFGSIADLDKVDGIGPKTLERLAPLISVE